MYSWMSLITSPRPTPVFSSLVSYEAMLQAEEVHQIIENSACYVFKSGL